ncbi:MAG: S-methyl-5'-thioadenosine phosphorylase [Candidatus Aminicenantes bacterium]|nr:S-methyl-5'-thioadenosine phosphorylase [Candidatus Aminicenantes bacterium]
MTDSSRKDKPTADIGILGGTGLYDMEGIQDLRTLELKTPFGWPSDAYTLGVLEGKRIAFLSRHGRGHRILPSEINYRANVYGFKILGVSRIISVNSVGSLKEEIKPRDLVFPDQFYDKTHRDCSFFGGGVVAHIGFANPVCSDMSRVLYETGKGMDLRVHNKGTYVCIQGPHFSTIAESQIYRKWGCDVIGMTGVTEAKLCREAEICYASMSLVTDYDVWHESEGPVSVEMILENMEKNVKNAKNLIKKAVKDLPECEDRACECGDALKNAIVTDPSRIPSFTRKKIDLIISKYLN